MIRQKIINSLSKVQVEGVSEEGEALIEAEADQLEALIMEECDKAYRMGVQEKQNKRYV